MSVWILVCWLQNANLRLIISHHYPLKSTGLALIINVRPRVHSYIYPWTWAISLLVHKELGWCVRNIRTRGECDVCVFVCVFTAWYSDDEKPFSTLTPNRLRDFTHAGSSASWTTTTRMVKCDVGKHICFLMEKMWLLLLLVHTWV